MTCTKDDIWIGGSDGCHTYRIPALIVTPAGTVLAFCEGRRRDASDGGSKDLLFRRSTDGGRTWSQQAVLYAEPSAIDPATGSDESSPDPGESRARYYDSIGNPTAVVDRDSGDILVAFIRQTTTVFISRSSDDGQTWSEPRDITDQARALETSFVPGPGIGIEKTRQPHTGRLVLPCYYRPVPTDVPTERPASAVVALYSDDGGESWCRGQPTEPGANECQVVELEDGRLMMNMRMQLFQQGRRAVAYSDDGGESWHGFHHDPNLIDPICQASLIDLDGDGRRLLFANPASAATATGGGERRWLTVRMSEDGGQSWPVARQIEPGRAAYSALAQTPDGEILCLYETGEQRYSERLRLARFTLDWLCEKQ